MKIFIPVILFYGNKNVCMGFMWWVLCALLLLKIIVSMKRCHEVKCGRFGVYFMKVVEM